MGLILLEGGAELGGHMSEPDLKAIELAGGFDIPVAILPTAAAPDNNHEHAGRTGVRWFKSLGVLHVHSLPVIDRSSADDPAQVAYIRTARLIYLLGGFPRYLGETLKGSLVWRAMLEAYEKGAVIGGSSAGAMVLCEHYYDPHGNQILEGLNLLSNTCILPHHNNFGKKWAPKLTSQLPQATLIGVDEQTGILNDGARGEWSVYGRGHITLYRHGQVETYMRGDIFRLQ